MWPPGRHDIETPKKDSRCWGFFPPPPPHPRFSIRIFVFHASEVSLIFKQLFIKTKRLVANKPSDLSSHSLAKIARGK